MSQELQAAVRNLSVAVDELMGLSNIMRDDVFQILNALAKDTESQMLGRAFVRSCWAYVEAVTFAVKRYTFSACQLGTVDLAPDDHAFLGDVRLIVDAEGSIAVQKDLTKTLDNVKRTFKLSARN